MKYHFSRIFVDEEAREDDLTTRVLDYFSGASILYLSGDKKLPQPPSELDVREGKQTLWLTRFKGQFLKPCPGTGSPYRCCNYLVINETTNCPIDCTYCILQGYINHPAVTIYTNVDKILRELEALSGLNPQRILRAGTGELTDSLALDPVTRLSHTLIPAVQQLPNLLLELKTKTDHNEHLLRLSPEKIVLSWSVNPQALVKSDERKAAGITQRLQAARRAQSAGFMIGLHFDPIIHYREWRQDYLRLVQQISRNISGQNLAWISLGSLRFPPALKDIIRQRFPRTPILSGEQITGLDGKTRYLRPLRLEMYRVIADALKQTLGDVFIYFCMESEDIWRMVLGESPENNLEVDWLFASHLHKKFPGLHLPEPTPDVYRQSIRWPTGQPAT